MKNLLYLALLLSPFISLSNNDRYRLIINDDPATKITIAWNQTSGTNPIVYYGTTDEGTNFENYPLSRGVDRSVLARDMDSRFVRLAGLTPNTEYYFVINDSEGTSERFWFRTAPSDNRRLSFIAGGDSRNNRVPRQNANLLVSKLKPHAVLFGGDMTRNDTGSEWLVWFEDWQLTIANDGRMIPIVTARGNHESSDVIYELFDTPIEDQYYATTFGNNLFRVYTLNSEISVTGDQKAWLEEDLAANENIIWKTAQYHKPMRPHTSAKAENDVIYNAWAQTFFDENIRLVFESDSHTVKTTWPVEPSSEPENEEGFIRNDSRGTVYTGEGCWGAPTRINDDDKLWTRHSGSFNQFKLVFVGSSNIELRTIKTDNAADVEEVANNDPFTLPANLDLYDPTNDSGAVVNISAESSPAPEIAFLPGTPTNYDEGNNLTFTIDVLEESASIVNVDFSINNVLFSSDTTAPYSFTNNFSDGTFTIDAIATDSNGLTGTTSLTINIGNSTTSNTIDVAVGDDDAEQRSNGSINLDSTDLELVYSGRGTQTVGIRFQNIDIPAGAKLDEVYLQFGTDETSSAATSLLIYSEDIGNAPIFEDEKYNITDRTYSSTSIPWSPGAWTTVNEAGLNQRSPDLKSMFQSIINREDWQSQNSAVFIIEGTGVSLTDPDARRTAESFEDNGSNPPQLQYTYSFDPDAVENPVNIAYESGTQTDYATGNNIQLDIEVLQEGYGITKVDFYIDGVLSFTDTEAPYSLNNNFAAGSYIIEAVATDESLRTNTDNIIINIGNSTNSGSVAIIDGDDDVEETEAGNIYFNSSDLEMVYDNQDIFGDDLPSGNQVIGLRFQNVNIPFGATITDARIQFRSDQVNTETASLLISSENIGNASSFEDEIGNVTSRNRNSTQIAWNPDPWSATDQVTADQSSPDITDILQPIIDRCDWNTGNSMVFMIEGTGVSLTDKNAKRVGDSFEGSSDFPPTLIFTYSYDSSVVVPNITEYIDTGIWTNGAPTASKQVIFKADYDTALGNINSCTCEVAENQTLTIRDGDFMNTQGDITVKGTLIVENGGSVVQVDDTALTRNNGTIEVKKTTPLLNGRGFTVLSSPMTAETRNGVLSEAHRVFKILPDMFTPHPDATTAINFIDVDFDYFSPATALEIGRGHLVFPQAPAVTSSMVLDHTYTQGTLNSGTIQYPLEYNGPSTENNFNLVGNPYPSAIDTNIFITDNDAIDEIYYWEHLTDPSADNPGDNAINYSMDDVSIYNLTGGIAAVNGGAAPARYMVSGQGFGIFANQSALGTPLTFTNAMRVTGNNGTVRNSQEALQNKIWLRLSDQDQSVRSTTLIGFMEEATPSYDQGYDSKRVASTVSLYSHISKEKQLSIQGRESFSNDIIVQLGFETNIDKNTNYSISIANLNGQELTESNIYLTDNLLDITVNLKHGDYSFVANASDNPERFTLSFNDDDSTLAIDDNSTLSDELSIYPNPSEGIVTLSYLGQEQFNTATITDISGKQVMQIDLKNFNQSLKIDLSRFTKGLYFIYINTPSSMVTKKIILK